MLETSQNEDLRYEISCLFSSLPMDLPRQTYSSLITALSTGDDLVVEETLNIIFTSFDRKNVSSLRFQRIPIFHSESVVSVILSRVHRSHTRNILKSKSCQILGYLYCGEIAMFENYPSFHDALFFVFDCLNDVDSSLVASAAGAFSLFTTCFEERNIEIFQLLPTLPSRLTELMLSHHEKIVMEVMKTIANIIPTPPLRSIMILVEPNILPNLLWLLDYPNKSIIKETCWIIDIISLESKERIQLIIDAVIIPRILALLSTEKLPDNESDSSMHPNASNIIVNILTHGSEEQKEYVLNEGAVKVMCELWKNINPRFMTRSSSNLLRVLANWSTALSNYWTNLSDHKRKENILKELLLNNNKDNIDRDNNPNNSDSNRNSNSNRSDDSQLIEKLKFFITYHTYVEQFQSLLNIIEK